MKKTQNLLFTLALMLIVNLCFSQDIVEKGSFKKQIDTDSISSLNPYIEDHTEQLNIKMIVSNNQLKYSLPYENGESASAKTNLRLSYGFRFTYKYFSVRLRIRPKLLATDQANKGKTDHFVMGFDVLLDKWAHFFEYDYRRGYYIDNTNLAVGNDTDFHIQFPNLTTNTFNGVSQYKFNKNYSIRAVEYNNEIQLKSAGTFMPGINYTYYTFKGANKKITTLDGPKIDRNPYNDYKGLSLIIEPGYYYTFVLDKYWFANVFAAPGFGVDFYNDKEFDNNTLNYDNDHRNTFFSIKTGASIGYNGKKFYFGSEFKYHGFDKKEIRLQASKTMFQVFVGYRFKAPKQVAKPLDYIEDKVTGLKKGANN